MPSIKDEVLALRNLQLSYKQSLIVEHKGHYFYATPQNIMWLERLMNAKLPEHSFVEDIHGHPALVHDIAYLWTKCCDTYLKASREYVDAEASIKARMVVAINQIPQVPENEE